MKHKRNNHNKNFQYIPSIRKKDKKFSRTIQILKKYFLKTYKNNGGKLDYNVEKDKGILDRKIEIAIKKAEIEEKDRIPHIIEISFTAIVYKYPDICEFN